MNVYRTSTAERLVRRLGLLEGMRAAARLLMNADEVIVDVPDETAQLVAEQLNIPVRAA
jgi:hypothetical protein